MSLFLPYLLPIPRALHPPKSRQAFARARGRSFGLVCEMRDDAFYMRRCVELARRAVGSTSPNPMVGCVIVKEGEIVGDGFHPKAGQPHAEVFALRDAGDMAENATAYVSLEPCNHYGRTPPCTEALIRAKIKHVVIGMVDPNPIVASKGVERLRESGIGVTVGVEETLCRNLNEAYIHRMITQKPFVTLRYSLSINGRILDQPGEGAEKSGGYYSKLLQEYDGVVTSSNLLAKTSTLPLSCETEANQPLQIIVASGGSSSLSLPSSIIGSATQIVVLANKAISVDSELEGIEVVVLEQMNMNSILDYLGHRGLCNVLLDYRGGGGGVFDLLEDGLNQHLVQKIVMELCPVWDSSEETSALAFDRKSLKLKDLNSRISNESALKLKDLNSRISYESVVVEGYIL